MVDGLCTYLPYNTLSYRKTTWSQWSSSGYCCPATLKSKWAIVASRICRFSSVCHRPKQGWWVQTASSRAASGPLVYRGSSNGRTKLDVLKDVPLQLSWGLVLQKSRSCKWSQQIWFKTWCCRTHMISQNACVHSSPLYHTMQLLVALAGFCCCTILSYELHLLAL